jgi:hypothetical protein
MRIILCCHEGFPGNTDVGVYKVVAVVGEDMSLLLLLSDVDNFRVVVEYRCSGDCVNGRNVVAPNETLVVRGRMVLVVVRADRRIQLLVIGNRIRPVVEKVETNLVGYNNGNTTSNEDDTNTGTVKKDVRCWNHPMLLHAPY